MYGRICISPFTWPIEAISEFVPVTRTRQRVPRTSVEPGFVSIATLAASIEDAAVVDLANAGPLV